jgi:RNA polymerase sigma-70 factor, ECF subfamily
MQANISGEITHLLRSVKQGDADARARVAELVYGELRKIAQARMRRERHGHTLQPTALVNEAYIQLVAQEEKSWQSRSHFFAIAAQLMRRILIDHARSAKAKKRGGDQVRPAPLEFDVGVEPVDIDEVLGVDAALDRLAAIDPRQARVVELRYFAGMTEEEVAEILQVSTRTVKRDWNMARLFLREEMKGFAES